MKNFLDSVIWGFFSLMFPETAAVRKIEQMSAAEFQNLAKRGDPSLGLSFPIYSLFSYADPLVRLAIRQIKYKKNSRMAKLFASILKDMIPLELEDEIIFTDFRDPIIVPIPSHKEKLKRKGYNQTEFVLKHLASISNYEIIQALEKIRSTEKQTGKMRHERLSNVRKSFKVKDGARKLIRDRNVIIFDDVVTTGATLNEARRVLKKAGARRIVGLTLAH